jgi:hypothetical protein
VNRDAGQAFRPGRVGSDGEDIPQQPDIDAIGRERISCVATLLSGSSLQVGLPDDNLRRRL